MTERIQSSDVRSLTGVPTVADFNYTGFLYGYQGSPIIFDRTPGSEALYGQNDDDDIIRLTPYVLDVRQFGAVGDGVTDDSEAFQDALDSLRDGAGTGVVTALRGRFLIDSSITVHDGITLVGPWNMPGEQLPASGASYDSLNGTLILNSSATITTKDAAGVIGFVVVRKGLDLPFADATAATAGVTAFAGTAFTVGGPDACFSRLLILGFARAIDSSGYERVRCELVQGDCTNGIRLVNVTDIAYIDRCHFWPFTTTHQSWTTNALLTRTGTAYEFSSVGDWSKFTNCFEYGYATGYDINSCDHVNAIGCGADYPGGLSSTSIGYHVRGSSRDALLLGCQAAAQGTAVHVNSTAAKPAARIHACNMWDNDTQHIRVQDGTAIIQGNLLTGGAIGITVDAASDGSVISGNLMDGLSSTPIVATGAALEKSDIFGNRFDDCTDTLGEYRANNNQAVGEVFTVYNAGAAGTIVIGRHARGDTTTPTISVSGDPAYRLKGMVYDGAAFRDIGQIRIQAGGVVSAGDTPGKWVIAVTPAGSTSMVDRWTVENNGALVPVQDNTVDIGTAALRINEFFAKDLKPGAGTVTWTSGSGTPEGSVTAAIGSLYTRTDGAGSTTLYVKESGAGNTGWVAK
jgi:hypothetical protein